MTKTARELLRQALELPEAERARLARTLLASTGDEDADEHELSPEWRAELERRIADEDPASWTPGDRVLARLKRAQRRDEAKARPKRARGA